ncbi:guanylyl cyclase 1 isoform X2 [Vigna umbellata]|uniref:guanylyl cyclase 1 isoform X2 n=1 Tax=Vigna umbellata TaxID=87088 RepID=UPI001F5FB024|nr:guanylyl cyclase 1 isoform X2 [Vigna umbellata]
MWPIYLLFNKILKTGDERELIRGDHLNAIDPYLFQQPSSNIDSHPSSLLCSHLPDVPHVNQIYTWDCGLACVLMVLRTIGVNNYDIQALAELCCTNSIWTVDLAYLLQRFSVTFSYFTVTFGANPNYCVESFYKEELPNDLVRVDLLFQKAMEAGIDIQVCCMPAPFLLDPSSNNLIEVMSLSPIGEKNENVTAFLSISFFVVMFALTIESLNSVHSVVILLYN